MKKNTTNRYRPITQNDCGTIPEPTARLVEKSFAENTMRNRRQALKQFQQWLKERQITDGLLRISEVTELRISDLEDNILRLRFSKTDQEGSGEHLYLCEDTRKIVAEWLERSELAEGYLFRRMTARGDNLYRDKQTGERCEADNQELCCEGGAYGEGVRTLLADWNNCVSGTVWCVACRYSSGGSVETGMPAHYARAQFAERGAIARFKDRKR